MMSSEFIIDVTESNFQFEVLAFSNNTPVLVDFWAEWCQPCHMLTPILEKLAREANGAFRLAKVDVDQNPGLANQFDIRSLPTVKAINKSQVVGEFIGAKLESQVRDFLKSLAPSQTQLELERGFGLLAAQDWGTASESFRKVLDSSPDDAPAMLGLAKSHLLQGLPGDAVMLLRNFPASKEYSAAEQLLPLAEIITKHQGGTLEIDDDDHVAIYTRALTLIAEGNLPAALDGLFDILRADKNYRGGEIKDIVRGALELLGQDHPESRKYRSELGSVLF